jgi:hypothetical protein
MLQSSELKQWQLVQGLISFLPHENAGEMHVHPLIELHLVLHFHHPQIKKKMLFSYSMMNENKISMEKCIKTACINFK